MNVGRSISEASHVGSRLVIRNTQSPGDILVLSAALRDLHIAHPGMYETDVWVSPGAEHIFWHNSDITTIHSARPPRGLKHFVAHYPLIKQSNQQRKHFLWGFHEYFNQKLGTKAKLTEFRPKLVMSKDEIENRPFKEPYWVFLSGGKRDFPAKIWDQIWWQELISATKNDINWVQCGGGSNNHIMHSAKRGILANKVAKTSCRDFIRLIYHSEGVVCAVTFAMHIAAALNKPCVVIAGGREPWWWEAYNKENRLVNMRIGDPRWKPPADDDFVPHRYLHTMGKLDCCRKHGCWKSKVTGRGTVCSNVVTQHGQAMPKCLAMITPEQVVEAIYSYRDVPQSTARAAIEIVEMPWLVLARGSEQWVNSLPVPRKRLSHADKRAPWDILLDTDSWLLWLEEGNKLAPEWEYALRSCSTPGIFGRVNRASDGRYYPYPGGFAVHTSLLQRSSTFIGMFEKIAPESYGPVDSFVQLSTRPAGIT